MALKYLVSNTTYDFGGPQYTNIGGGLKRLNCIASGKTHQLGMATDKTCSQYSPLVMKVNGTNYYIGRSQSGSYITSDSISSTRINTHTSSGYSTQYYTYGANVYTIIHSAINSIKKGHDWNPAHTEVWEYNTYTSTALDEEFSMSVYSESYLGYSHTITWYTSVSGGVGRQTFTSTSNIYYTTIISNAVNITVSTTKSTSSSSHNFV